MDTMTPDEGQSSLRWVFRFQLALLPIVFLIWWNLRGRSSAFVFLVGGLTSVLFWGLQSFLVGRMLTPSLRLRWFYALLSMGKLALIVVVLRGMMERYPAEGLPLASGLLLFVVAILLEAMRLIFKGAEPIPPDPPSD
jgi:hypothetical protein